jgi:hypothetical protein
MSLTHGRELGFDSFSETESSRILSHVGAFGSVQRRRRAKTLRGDATSRALRSRFGAAVTVRHKIGPHRARTSGPDAPDSGRSGHRLAAGCLAVRQRWWRGRAGLTNAYGFSSAVGVSACRLVSSGLDGTDPRVMALAGRGRGRHVRSDCGGGARLLRDGFSWPHYVLFTATVAADRSDRGISGCCVWALSLPS